NNSGVVQTLSAASEPGPEINFYDSATAGEDTILYQGGDLIHDNSFILFNDTSSPGSATIINNGNGGLSGPRGTEAFDSSAAANATIFNQSASGRSTTTFDDSSKAGSATIVCEAGTDLYGDLLFRGSSSAEDATITVEGAPPGFLAAEVSLEDTSTADN